jgi:cytochrome c553
MRSVHHQVACWRRIASNATGLAMRPRGFDKLTGKSASKLYKELKEFQSGGEDENIMAYHARGFTDAQLLELTQWLSTQP